MLDLLFLNTQGSPTTNKRLAKVAQSSLRLQSNLFCTVLKTFWSIHMHCVPTRSIFALLLVEALGPPGDEVSDTLSLAPWMLVCKRR